MEHQPEGPAGDKRLQRLTNVLAEAFKDRWLTTVLDVIPPWGSGQVGLRRSEIAHQTGFPPEMVTKLVELGVRKGLVRRRSSGSVYHYFRAPLSEPHPPQGQARHERDQSPILNLMWRLN